MTLLVDQALRLADDGLPVFPCAGNKAPTWSTEDGGHGHYDATTDPKELERLFGHKNAKLIGLRTGEESGIVVVDIDIKKGKNGRQWERYHDLPTTRKIQTVSGGDHFYFKHPGRKVNSSTSDIFEGVDIKGDPGYVICPPSDGYSIVLDEDIAEMPDWLVELCNAPKATEQKSKTGGLGLSLGFDSEKALNEITSQDGSWHDKVLRLTGHWISRGWLDDEILSFAPLITWPGYSPEQTRREMKKMIDGGREKWDRQGPVNEYGNPQKSNGAAAPERETIFQQWQPINANEIEPRRWLYGRDYIRKFLTATVAPGGLGKSTLVLAEAISMASGMPVLGVLPEGGKVKQSQLRVGYFNGEDPMDEIQRRVLATCQQYFVSQAALADRLWLASGREHRQMMLMTGDEGTVNEDAFDFLQGFAISNDLDVLIFDPLANMTTSPETNDVFRLLTARLNTLAGNTDTAVHIVHHTRKLQPGMAATDNDARGGRALVDGARSVRVLNHMSAEEGARAGLESHIDHFRSEDAKANLSRRSERASWFARIGVKLENGDNVATVEPWQWPDAFDGVTESDLLRVQQAIERSERPARRSPQAREWAGNIVADVLNLNISDHSVRSRIRVMLETWIKSGAFKIDEIKDVEKGRNTPVLVVDNWADAE